MIIQEQDKLLFNKVNYYMIIQEQGKLLHDYLGRMPQRAPLTPQ